MKKNLFIPIFVAAGLSGFAPSAHAQGLPVETPESASIEYANASGSGCDTANKTTIYITPDKKALSVIFHTFGAQAGPGITSAEGHKFCQLVVMLNHPPGWTYSLFNATYRGYAELDEGVQSRQQSMYWFLGNPLSSAETTLLGPFSGNYDRTDEFEIMAWAPCSGRRRPLNIKTNVSVSNRNKPENKGFMNVESAELEIIYGLNWRRCPPPPLP